MLTTSLICAVIAAAMLGSTDTEAFKEQADTLRPRLSEISSCQDVAITESGVTITHSTTTITIAFVDDELVFSVATETRPITVSSSLTPANSPTDTDAGTDTQRYLATLRTEIHQLTNEVRAENNLDALSYNDSLATVARAHSEDMATRDYVSHTNLDSCDVSCRLEPVIEDSNLVAWGENIAWRESARLPNATAVAEGFMKRWLESEGHRENILAPDFTMEGIGAARTQDDVYVTVNFAG